MPVFNFINQPPPVESEVKIMEMFNLKKGEVFLVENHSTKENIFVCEGSVEVKSNKRSVVFGENDVAKFEKENNHLIRISAIENSIIARVGGDWNNNCGTCGVFKLNANTPKNIGDVTEYKRNTQFDNHFHDCDEFWILYEGEGEVVTEGKRFQVSAGDCVYTKAGDHHDFPIVNKTIKGVWFETSYIGKMREGHLWNHAHNKAESENEL